METKSRDVVHTKAVMLFLDLQHEWSVTVCAYNHPVDSRISEARIPRGS